MAKNHLFFSVIIPTLNEEKYLPLLLKDLEKQTFRDFEVLVTDGGSTDKTLTKGKLFESRLPLSVFVNKKKNVSLQRNFGAKHARGQYLIFFDADVRIPAGFLKKLSLSINKNKGLLFTTYLLLKNKPQTQIILTELTNFIIETFNMLGKPFAPGFNIIVEKDLFHKLGGFDHTLKLAEDHDLVQRARKMGVLLKVLKEPKLYPSFRRPEKIGYLRFLTQYAVAGLYSFAGEPIRKELFDYPMGGHLYSGDKEMKNTQNFLNFFRQKVGQITRNIDLPF